MKWLKLDHKIRPNMRMLIATKYRLLVWSILHQQKPILRQEMGRQDYSKLTTLFMSKTWMTKWTKNLLLNSLNRILRLCFKICQVVVSVLKNHKKQVLLTM